METLSALSGVAGPLFSGFMNQKAASTAAASANAATRLQQQRYDDAKSNLSPFITGGRNALASYDDALGLNGTGPQNAFYTRFQNDPGFNSAMQFGNDQINANLAAQGHGQLSGNQLTALQDWGQHSLYDAYHTRLADLFNEAKLGEGGAALLGQSGTTGGAYQGNDMITAGQYQGAGLAQFGAGAGTAMKNFAAVAPSLAQKYYGSGGYDPSWANTATVG